MGSPCFPCDPEAFSRWSAGAHRVRFPSLREHCPLWPDIQCLGNHCFIYFIPVLVVPGGKIHLILVVSSCLGDKVFPSEFNFFFSLTFILRKFFEQKSDIRLPSLSVCMYLKFFFYFTFTLKCWLAQCRILIVFPHHSEAIIPKASVVAAEKLASGKMSVTYG